MYDIRERPSLARGRRSEDRKDIFNRFSWDERAVHESAHGTLAVPERNSHFFRAEPIDSGEAIVGRNAAAHNNDNVIPSPDTFPMVLPVSQDESQNDKSTIWTLSSTQDTTIHYEMDIVEDVGSLLEEFSRLKRLGNFEEAEQYFQGSLSAFMELSPVTIEFADMLVEQGSYRRLHRVLSQHQQQELSTSDGISSLQEGNPAKFLYQANLHLLRDFAFMQSHGSLDEAYGTVRSLERQMRSLRRRRRKDPTLDLDSAEVQVIRYALLILSQVERETDLIPEHEFNFWSNWHYLYSALVAEGRVWDARDLMLASIQAEGAVNAWNLIFGAELGSSNEPFRKLMDDWCLHRYDESTYLAILDILVSLGRSLSSWSISIPERQDLLTAQRCLQYAQALATCLKENNPQLVKSRPYLQWVIAEAEMERKLLLNTSDLRDHLEKFPGLTIWRSSIPIYLPIKTENPKWTAHLDGGRNYDLLETVLQTAQDLNDYRTEVLCLDDLKEIRESKRSSKSIYSLSDWCAIVIERAIAQRLAEDLSRSEEAFQDTKEGFSTYLPQYIKDRLEALGLDKAYLAPSRTGKPHDPGRRQRSITDVPTPKQDTRTPDPFESLSDEKHGQSKSLSPLQRPGRTYTGSGESDSDDDKYTTDSSFDTARSDDGWMDDEHGHSTSLIHRTQRFGPSE
ncbi:hypothetical protein AtubIFM56815_002195 [Aspergillus tubingensis]|uniref:Uncharacterized protein n=1 Tax=Aspergillus tubingensis TaxID=5068 RepID=A0A9W6EQ83_ASPTU|nr:hypothetical protein AtubIFM56815_002195 [Aspergillus tubingensis]GLB13322.1 hypothetical protein AtubIFM61612_000728 [Aspergillus tubingensis]